MSSFLICLYLDEDVNVLVSELLGARGFNAITARDAGQLHRGDAEQFAYAVSQTRALMTHNQTDFEALVQSYFEAGQMHYGLTLSPFSLAAETGDSYFYHSTYQLSSHSF